MFPLELYSAAPVRYANGAVMLPQTDVAVPAGGLFGYTRYFSNQTYASYNGVNGYNWFAQSMPYLTTYGGSVAVAFDPNNPIWFDLVSGSYVPRYGVQNVSLTHNSGAQTFTLVQTSNGLQVTTVFNDFTTGTAPGGFLSQSDARGITVSVTARSGDSITTLQRSYTLNSVTTNETLTFSYFTSGTWNGKLQTVTYAQKVGSGSWTNLSQVTYAYYGSSDSNGNLDDLQSATQQIPNGSGGWNTSGIIYYRYYLSGAAHGYQHGLKMHFGPESYRQILNASINPLTASDATVQPYADHYFEYDSSSRAVTKEVSAVCATCPGGGSTTDTFTYTQSSNSNGFNSWATKTVQSLPDSSQIIVYSNYAGMPMLSINVDPSSNKWITFYRYDDTTGSLIWKAHPSAVTGYDDTHADLLIYNSGTNTYTYLSNSTGLIEVTNYFSSTGGGGVAGYVSDINVRQGQSGSNVMTRSITYTSNTAGGITVYLPATVTQYPVAGGTSSTIVTNYSYTFYSGTNQVSQRTTTVPSVPTSQNGSGSTYTIVEQYDTYGQLTQRTDERGIVNQYTYGGLLGRMTQQVLNYQSGVTQPGVNVTTTFTYDSYGRLIQTTGPSHTVDLSGTATSVQPVTWTVYVPSTQPGSGTWVGDQVWKGNGYATSGPTYTLINPVRLTFKTKDGTVTDVITSKRSSGSGALSSSNTFNQTDYQTWVSTQYNQQGQTISMRTYFLIPSSGTGTSGTNYAETDLGYDALERQNRVASPGGTITRTVWTTPQNVASVWVGTNDTGATDSNPAGSGSPNNMVMVTANQWDGGSAGGDGNLTQVTQYASASDTRVTSYGYDWRDRRISITDATSRYTLNTYDNLDRVTHVRRYTSASGNLIGHSQTNYDNRGRVYQQITYGVDPSTGSTGFGLAAQQTFATGVGMRSVAVSDVNGDGKPDLVAASYQGTGKVGVLLGNGDGTFQASLTFTSKTWWGAVGDVNGDGNPDIVTALATYNTVGVLLGNGNGAFQAQQTFAVGNNPKFVTVADVNRDGALDLLVVNQSSNTVGVLLGNGNGTFQTQNTYAIGSNPYYLAVSDLNGDGMPDLVATNAGASTLSVLLGNGNGTFQPQTTLSAFHPHGVAASDVNGDGITDLVVANLGNVSVMLGNGNGTFQAPNTVATSTPSYTVAVADLNGDGNPDIAVACGGFSGTVAVLLGNGNGTFQAPKTFHVGNYPLSVVTTDLNGDGLPDIVVSNTNTNHSVGVLLNTTPVLTTNNVFDPSGNLIMQLKGGDGKVFTKYTYNGVNWVTATYRGYNLAAAVGYSAATSLTNDTILSQVLNTYDEVGNLVSVASYDRLNDATGTGALSYGTQPEARVSYSASWFDGIDRVIATADYGALSSFTRPSTPPSSSSTVLVNSTSYDDASRVYQVTDPLGYVTQTTYDNANRTTQTVEANGTGVARTTNWTYTLDGLVATLQAVNSTTGNQTTTYTYGTTLSTSGVARNDLLASVTYPDSVSGSDVVSYTYNRLGQQVTVTDQRGTVRTFDYDKLGRRTDDCVTTVGSGTDNAVLRISATYEVRGMIATMTSYNNATPGSGTALNQIAYTYNSFRQLTEEQQDHAGTVSGSSPNVQYGYDSGGSGSNEIRPTSITYPNGRVINFVYGSGMDSTLNRITNVQDNSTSVNLATYTYLGLGTVIRIDYAQPQVRLDLWGGTSGTFNGLDLFNRIVDQRWINYNTSTDLDRYQYGYDQDSNRIWKANTVGSALDEFYTYDALNRLTEMQRGTLNGGKTGISGTPVREMDYTLDPTGNWPAYLTKTSGTTDLNQGRTSNTVNEITNVTQSGGTPLWVTPAYDAAGNMTTLPQVSTPTSSFTAVYDAWNRMVKLSAGGSTVATYAYDGSNRRITKVTTATSETRHFYYTSQWQDIEERTGSPAAMERQYVWGIRYVDELICRDRTSERYYAMQDANFNLTAICDTTATMQERYLYDPYGNVTYMNASWTVIGSSAHSWQINHQGLLLDVESGIIYNRNRMLHPTLGMFTRRDPIPYAEGVNLYEYAESGPPMYLDAAGTKSCAQRRDECYQWASDREKQCNDRAYCICAALCAYTGAKSLQVLGVACLPACVGLYKKRCDADHQIGDECCQNAYKACLRLGHTPGGAWRWLFC